MRQKGVQHLRKVRQGQERQGQHWHHGHDGPGLEVSRDHAALHNVFKPFLWIYLISRCLQGPWQLAVI